MGTSSRLFLARADKKEFPEWPFPFFRSSTPLCYFVDSVLEAGWWLRHISLHVSPIPEPHSSLSLVLLNPPWPAEVRRGAELQPTAFPRFAQPQSRTTAHNILPQGHPCNTISQSHSGGVLILDVIALISSFIWQPTLRTKMRCLRELSTLTSLDKMPFQAGLRDIWPPPISLQRHCRGVIMSGLRSLHMIPLCPSPVQSADLTPHK